jgi:hypothetical protein
MFPIMVAFVIGASVIAGTTKNIMEGNFERAKDIITLDNDNDYLVYKKVVLDGINYYYVINTNDYSDTKYLYEDLASLVEVENDDDETLEKLIVEIGKTINYNELKNIIES